MAHETRAATLYEEPDGSIWQRHGRMYTLICQPGIAAWWHPDMIDGWHRGPIRRCGLHLCTAGVF